MPPVKFIRSKSYGGFPYGYYRVGSSYTDPVHLSGRRYGKPTSWTKSKSLIVKRFLSSKKMDYVRTPTKRKAPPSPPRTAKKRKVVHAAKGTARLRALLKAKVGRMALKTRVGMRPLSFQKKTKVMPKVRSRGARKVGGRRYVRRRKPRYSNYNAAYKASRKSALRAGIATPGSISGGFFATPSQRDQWAKFTRAGALMTQETAGRVTQTVATAPVYVGHSTLGNVQKIFEMIFKALIKNLVKKAGIEITDFNALNDPYGDDFQIQLLYRASVAGAIVTNTYNKTAATSFGSIANSMAGAWVDYLVANPNAVLTMMTYRQVVSASTTLVTLSSLKIANARVHMMAKSTLKVQNVTLADIDEMGTDPAEEGNVLRVPLYGKRYEGSGSGMVHKEIDTREAPGVDQKALALLASQRTGIVISNPTQAWWREPPTKGTLIYVKKVSKAHLDPGQLKTDVLTQSKVQNINTFMQGCQRVAFNTGSLDAGVQIQRYGKYAIFGLERMITYLAENRRPAIAYECNWRFGCYILEGRTGNTVEQTDVELGVNDIV